MKKSIIYLATTGVIFLVFQAFVINTAPGPGVPADVQDLLKSSCNDCHSNSASNKKSKNALNFDQWDDYKDSKKDFQAGGYM